MKNNKYQIEKILNIFQNGDPRMIDFLKNEAKTRLKKYALFNNRYEELQEYEQDRLIEEWVAYGKPLLELVKDDGRMIDDNDIIYKIARYEYDMPDDIWVGCAEAVYTSDDIDYYENFIDNWADGICKDVRTFREEYYKLEDFDFDADCIYIFLGSDCKCPKPWDSLQQIIFYIAKRASWRNGWHTEFYSNSNPCSRGEYVFDLPIGSHKVFSYENDKEFEMVYKNGLPWEGRIIFEEDESLYEMNYKKGERHGDDMIRNLDGRTLHKISYANGQPHGKEIIWRHNGEKEYEAIYKKGELVEGYYFEEDGTILTEKEMEKQNLERMSDVPEGYYFEED